MGNSPNLLTRLCHRYTIQQWQRTFTNDLWMRLSLSHNENYYPCHQKFVHNTGILLPLGECCTTMEPQHSLSSSRLTPILSQLLSSRILLTKLFLKELLPYQTQSKII